MDRAASVEVPVKLPRDAPGVAARDVVELAAELRRLWAIEQVRLRRLGVGRGAEVAGTPRAAFMRMLGDHGVPVIDYPLDDLRQEIASLRGS